MLSRARLSPCLLMLGSASVLCAQSLVVDKPSLTFSGQFGGSVISQNVSITSTGASIPFVLVAPPSSTWLKVNGQGTTSSTTPNIVAVTADPTGLNAGTYNAQIAVIGGATNLPAIQVTFTISSIGVNPSNLAFSYTAGTLNFPTPQSVTLGGATTQCTATVNNISGGNWFSLLQSTCNSPGSLTFLINSAVLAALAPGSYSGSVSISPVPAGNSPAVVVTLSLTVIPTPAVTLNPGSLAFNFQINGTNNITSQPLSIITTSTSPLNYSLTSSVDSGSNWIATPIPSAGATDSSGQAQITVGVLPGGLAPGNYSGKITALTPGGTPTQTVVPIKLTVSNSALLNVPSGSLNFTYQLGTNIPPSQNVNITATSGTLSYAVTQSGNSPWLSVPNAGTTTSPLTVAVNPTSLAPGNYTATISIVSATPGSVAQTIGVNLKVTNDPVVTASVSSLAFPYQIAQAVPAPQTIRIGSSTGIPLNYSATLLTSTAACGNSWLQVNGGTAAVTGATDGVLTVSVSPAGLPAATCNGSITVTATNPVTGLPAVNSPLVIPVTLYVSATALLVVTPNTPPVFSVGVGTQTVPPQNINLTSTGPDLLNYSVLFQTNNGGSNWLFVGPLTGATNSNNVLTVSVIPGVLAAGTYTGTITITATNPTGPSVANSPVIIPVTLSVTPGSLTVTSTSLNFEQTSGGPPPAAQQVTVGSNGQTLNYTAVANGNASVNWLTVSPASGNTSTSGVLTISADGSKLTPGTTYQGTVTVTSPGAGNSPTVINVAFKINQGTLTAPTQTLSFTQAAGGTPPAPQTITVGGSPGALNFTVSASTKDGANWLSATPATGTTPGNVQILVSAGNLTAGNYSGTVTINSTGALGSPISVPVSLTVVPPVSLTASPASLTFAYTTGQAIPPAQVLAIASSAPGTPFSVQVQFSGPAAWLVVTPTSSTAPANLSVSIAPTTLPAGTYNGSITLTSPNALAASAVQVTLTVTTIAKPVINAIGNAANYSTGAVSPGENIVIFGTGVGPGTLAAGAVVNGAFTTTAGNTRVLFDGAPAPVIYASANQTSVMVPYGITGRGTTSIVVEYFGQQSNPTTYFVTASAPGIYTLNQQGSGPGAILNQDGVTVNGPNTPEKRGNVIAVFMTGEGQTDPQGVDGAIIPAVVSALKKPVLPVTATIGGLPATVAYAGSAPGLVSGIMQVNLVIPDTVSTGGAIPVIITVGTTTTQTGSNAATVAVQ